MSFTSKIWAVVYRDRMSKGLEYCRICNTKEDLTLDHIVPRSLGGGNNIENITILCQPCNFKKDCQYYSDLLEQALTWPPEDCKLIKASELKSGDRIAQGEILKTLRLKNVIQVFYKKRTRTKMSEFNNDFDIVVME